MQATNAKNMRRDEFLPLTMRLIRHVRNVPRATFLLSSFLGLALLLACSFGCAPSSSQGDGKQSGSASASNDLPELTQEMIHERINDAGRQRSARKRTEPPSRSVGASTKKSRKRSPSSRNRWKASARRSS